MAGRREEFAADDQEARGVVLTVFDRTGDHFQAVDMAGGLANAYALHRGPLARVAAWDVGVPPPLRVRVAGALSLLLWTGVIVCGRLIAYL